MGLIKRVEELYTSLKLLWNIKVNALPVARNGNPRPIIIYEGQFYYWDPDDKNYKTVASSGVPAHTHVGADITDLAPILAAWLVTSENYADGLFATIVGTPTPAVAFDTIQEIAAYLEADQTAMASILTALGNRVMVDTNAQGLSSTEKLNARTNIGLENLDNTSDANKPVSSAQAAAISSAVAALPAVKYDTNAQGLTSPQKLNARTNIGLDQIDNTSDANKPVSTATAAAILAASGVAVFRNERSANYDPALGFVGTGMNLTKLGTVSTNSTLTFAGSFAQRFLFESYSAASSSSAVAGIRYGNFGFMGSLTYLGGGFDVSFTFFIKYFTSSSYRFGVGLRGNNAVPTNVDPSSLTNIIYVGLDSGDANIQIMYNDASGTATKVNTGMARPVVDIDDVFVARMFHDGTSGNVVFTLTNLKTGVSFTHTANSDLPAGNTILHINHYSSCGLATSQAGIGMINWSVKTP